MCVGTCGRRGEFYKGGQGVSFSPCRVGKCVLSSSVMFSAEFSVSKMCDVQKM